MFEICRYWQLQVVAWSSYCAYGSMINFERWESNRGITWIRRLIYDKNVGHKLIGNHPWYRLLHQLFDDQTYANTSFQYSFLEWKLFFIWVKGNLNSRKTYLDTNFKSLCLFGCWVVLELTLQYTMSNGSNVTLWIYCESCCWYLLQEFVPIIPRLLSLPHSSISWP